MCSKMHILTPDRVVQAFKCQNRTTLWSLGVIRKKQTTVTCYTATIIWLSFCKTHFQVSCWPHSRDISIPSYTVPSTPIRWQKCATYLFRTCVDNVFKSCYHSARTLIQLPLHYLFNLSLLPVGILAVTCRSDPFCETSGVLGLRVDEIIWITCLMSWMRAK